MVEIRNRLTGSIMYVADDRVSEYLARGHSLAKPEPIKERTEPVEEKPKVSAPKKATTKKATKKKG